MTEHQADWQQIALAKLREKFPDNLVNHRPVKLCSADEYKKLPKAECKICGGYHAKTHTGHMSYVGHAALTDRLLSVDPMWSWKPLALTEKGLPQFDDIGGLWIEITICGVTRLGYGNAEPKPYSEIGSREKEVIGDALRNAAMRFGAALEFWHKGTLTPENGDVEKPIEDKKPEIEMPKAKSSTPMQSSTQRLAEQTGELAEQGELAFISQKLAALKDGGAALIQALGMESLDDLTKENFRRIKEALKKKG